MMSWENIDPSTAFRGKEFRGIDFSGRSLVGFDFSESVLHDCKFDSCDLSHANFENADLYKSSFQKSILYVTKFKNSNLTRCDFSNAYIYGIQVTDYSNVTYAQFSNVRIETQRRSSKRHTAGEGLLTYQPGSLIPVTAQLCTNSYFANGYVFSFADLGEAERHMQLSQVFNRLKRLFSANLFGEEVRSCNYWERYHRTRSWYKYHHFTGEPLKEGDFRESFRRIALTSLSYLHEITAGYGLKPAIVFRNMAIFYAMYLAVIFGILTLTDNSGILYSTISTEDRQGTLSLTTLYTKVSSFDTLKIMYFALFSMFSLTFQSFQPYGHLVWVSSIAAILGLSLVALLVSAVFSWIRLE